MSEELSNQSGNEAPAVTLSLGQLSITPEQLILLREGDMLQLPCEFPLSGALTLEGKPWAYVSIEQSESGLEITVRNLSAVPL